jgi:hypothetical protein
MYIVCIMCRTCTKNSSKKKALAKKSRTIRRRGSKISLGCINRRILPLLPAFSMFKVFGCRRHKAQGEPKPNRYTAHTPGTTGEQVLHRLYGRHVWQPSHIEANLAADRFIDDLASGLQ